jgi:hypothetical protein
MADGSGKLYFLRDRGRRPASRLQRKRTDGLGATGAERTRTSSPEALWLSRILIGEAGYLILYWLGVVGGVVDAAEGNDSRMWLYSFLPADLFVASASGLAGFDLLRSSVRRDFFLLIAAGGLIFLSLERLTYGIASSFLRDLTPGERLQVTLMGVSLYVGMWAASYALRTRRGGE